MTANLSNTEIVLQRVVISYPHLFTPKAVGGQGQAPSGPPKFSANFIIVDQSQMEQINAAMMAAFTAKFGAYDATTNPIPHGFRWALKPVDAKKTPSLAGHQQVSANADQDRRPGVVDANMQKVLDPSDIFAGCLVNAHIAFYGYDTAGNRGIGAGLRNVQLVDNQNVTRLDNSKTAEMVFEAIPGAPSPSAPPPQQPGPMPPPAAQAQPYNPAAPQQPGPAGNVPPYEDIYG